jgi:multidrug efflux pump subunit AcrA (membrane-fusion protein)
VVTAIGEGREDAAEPVFPGAAISGRYAGRERRWQGVVRRIEGELDPRSRLANLVVEVADPYADPEAPLVVGAFVDVEIAGRSVDGVRTLPRYALRDDGSIWVAAADGTLRVRPAGVVHRRGEEVLVYADLEPGEEVVVSALQGVTDGMRIRVAGEEPR